MCRAAAGDAIGDGFADAVVTVNESAVSTVVVALLVAVVAAVGVVEEVVVVEVVVLMVVVEVVVLVVVVEVVVLVVVVEVVVLVVRMVDGGDKGCVLASSHTARVNDVRAGEEKARGPRSREEGKREGRGSSRKGDVWSCVLGSWW